MNKRIVGVFITEQEASSAIEDLKRQGFRTEDISVIARNKRDVNAISEETGTKAPEGMASGAATGGLLGGVTGLLAGIGALAIPGIGPIIAAGPIAATLTGAAVGAGAGGLVGGLIGLGIPENEAESYNEYVNDGRILVMVEADTAQEAEVYRIFRDNHSLNSDYFDSDVSASTADRFQDRDLAGDAPRSVNNTVDAAFNGSGLEGRTDTGLDTMNSGTMTGVSEDRASRDVYQPGMTGSVTNKPDLLEDEEMRAVGGYRTADDTLDTDWDPNMELDVNDPDYERKLRLREEQLNISKNRVQTGEVSVRKEIVEEQKTINVPVSHEEVVIERRPVHDETSAGPIGQEETIRIPVSEEQVEVSKRPVVTGEVEVHKREIQSTEQVQDTVKREEARVDKTGGAQVRGDERLSGLNSRVEEDESLYNKRR